METDWSLVRREIESFGITILPYEECDIGEHIGSGGTMNVYEGTCKIKNKISPVAFKEHRYFLGRRQVKDVDQILDQFRHEIKLMGKMQDHPNIIQIYGVTFKNERPVLVVELAYATLDEYLRERLYTNDPLSWTNKTKLCLDVLSGVRGLCEADIIHGDLKGPNILVLINEDEVPKAKISDFGYSSSVSSLQSCLGGTRHFLAPENTPKHPELSFWRKKPEQDIYGLGMVTFQIATDGKIPYGDTEDVEDIFAAKDDPTTLLEELPENTPEEYQEIIRATTKIKPYERAPLDIVDKLFKKVLKDLNEPEDVIAMLLEDVKKKLKDSGTNIIPSRDCDIGELIAFGRAVDVHEGTYLNNKKKKDAAFKQQRALNHLRQDIEEFTHHLCKELELMKKLKYHPNIVQILGVTFNNTMPILIVELAGGTLEDYLTDRLTENQPVDWFEKTFLCLDVLQGIRGLNDANIVHGDLNAASVLVFIADTEIPKAKLSDFGSSSSIKKSEGTFAGTLFSSPEQFPQNYAELSQWKEKSEQDIYGLGMVTFQIAIDGSKPPYENANDNDILAAKADPNASFLLKQLSEDIPEEYKEIIVGTTKFEPEERTSLDNVERLLRKALRRFTPAIKNIIKSEAVGDDGVDIKKDIEIDKENLDIYKELSTDKAGVDYDKAIITATEQGNKGFVRLLLTDYHVDPTITDKAKGLSLVHYAAKHERTEVIQMLVDEFGMDVNAKDNFGRTALHYAAKNGNVKVVKFLASLPSTIKGAVNNDGWAAIHYAARYKHIDVINALTNGIGVDLNLKDGSGRTAIYIAARQGNVEMVRRLLDLEVDINIRTWDGWTPLHAACHSGDLETVKLLLDNGANPNMKVTSGDKKGYTPLNIASYYKHAAVVKILENANAEIIDLDLVNEDRDTKKTKELLNAYMDSKKTSGGKSDDSNKDALFWAAELGYNNVIRLLVSEYKVEVGMKDSSKGLTAIHFATLNGHADTIMMFVKEFHMKADVKNKKGASAIHYAAKMGHIYIIKMLIKDFNIDINAKDNLGRIALHYAAKSGNVKVIKFLAALPATDKSAVSKNGWAALHYAARYMHIDVIQALMNGIEVDVNFKDGSGRTALYIAVRHSNVELVRKLLSLKADINIVTWDGWAPLHAACHGGDFETVQLLLDNGADINMKISSGDKKGYTPLDIASVFKHAVIIKTLEKFNCKLGIEIIDSDAIIEWKDAEKAKELLNTYIDWKKASFGVFDPDSDFKETLFWAAELGYNVVIKLLVREYKVDVTAKDNAKGLTAIHFAARNGRADTVKMLVNDFHMEVNVINKKGTNPIHYAAKMGHVDIIKILINEPNIDVNASDNFGRTAIHYAAKNGKVEVIKFFISISSSADVNAKNSDGWTPLHYAARYKHVEVTKMLADVNGIILDTKDGSSRTAMFMAARQGHVEIIRVLIVRKASVNLGKLDGWMPLHIAAYFGKFEAVQLLIENGADINAKITSGDKKGNTPVECATDAEVIAVFALFQKVKEVKGKTGRKKIFRMPLAR